MEMKFEEKLAKLEEIVTKLENEKLGLDESVKLYEEAKALSAELSKELNESIGKLAMVVENGEIKPLEDTKIGQKDI